MNLMADDLVVRLLAAIGEREQQHHRVAEELREAARMKMQFRYGEYLRTVIDDGLRLCQAHRQIIERHQPVGGYKPPSEMYGDENRCSECGGFVLVAGFGQRGWRSRWPCRTLRDLAEGFGVKEASDGE